MRAKFLPQDDCPLDIDRAIDFPCGHGDADCDICISYHREGRDWRRKPYHIDHVTAQRRRSRLLAWLQSIGFVLVVGLLNGAIGI